MKIAVVHSFYSRRNPSGENTIVQEQVSTLRTAGYDVRLIARHTDGEEQSHGYLARAVITTATGYGASPETDLVSFNPDIIHLHNTFPNWGTRWLRRWGSRTVTTLHNYRTVCAAATLFRDGNECRDCLRIPIIPAVRHGCYRDTAVASLPLAIGASPYGGIRALLQYSARLIALNENQAAIIKQLTNTPVRVIPNAVPLAKPGVCRDSRSWVYVGRVTMDKGLGRLLVRWPVGHRLDVIGSGPDLDRLKALNVPGVTWRGVQSHEIVLRELGGYAGLLIPSAWSEGIPTVALEAMARGVPLGVSPEVASGPALVRNGAGAILPLSGSSQELSDCLDTLRRGGIASVRALELHASRFSPDVWLHDIQQLYAEVRRD